MFGCAVINFWATRNKLDETKAWLSVMQNLHLYRVILNLVRTMVLRHVSRNSVHINVFNDKFGGSLWERS